jgi:hypothetical protein
VVNLFAGLILFSVVVALFAIAVPEYVSPWERLKAGLLTLLVMWLIYTGLIAFYLFGTGVAELENARTDARLEEVLRR